MKKTIAAILIGAATLAAAGAASAQPRHGYMHRHHHMMMHRHHHMMMHHHMHR